MPSNIWLLSSEREGTIGIHFPPQVTLLHGYLLAPSLTGLFSVAWRLGTVPVACQTRVMALILKKREGEGPEGVLKLLGCQTARPPQETLFQGAGKVTQRLPKLRLRILPLPWNSGPALYPCRSVGGVMGVYIPVDVCFVDLEKAEDCVQGLCPMLGTGELVSSHAL